MVELTIPKKIYDKISEGLNVIIGGEAFIRPLGFDWWFNPSARVDLVVGFVQDFTDDNTDTYLRVDLISGNIDMYKVTFICPEITDFSSLNCSWSFEVTSSSAAFDVIIDISDDDDTYTNLFTESDSVTGDFGHTERDFTARYIRLTVHINAPGGGRGKLDMKILNLIKDPG